MKNLTYLLALTSGLLLTGLAGCHRHEPLTAANGRNVGNVSRSAPTHRGNPQVAAATLTSVLTDRGVSVDAPVMPYLPGYWHKAMFMELTFRDVLRADGVQSSRFRRKTHWEALVRLASGYGFRADNPAYDYTDDRDPFLRVLVAGLNGYHWTGNADTDQRMANLYFDAQSKPTAGLAAK